MWQFGVFISMVLICVHVVDGGSYGGGNYGYRNPRPLIKPRQLIRRMTFRMPVYRYRGWNCQYMPYGVNMQYSDIGYGYNAYLGGPLPTSLYNQATSPGVYNLSVEPSTGYPGMPVYQTSYNNYPGTIQSRYLPGSGGYPGVSRQTVGYPGQAVYG